MMHLIKCNKCGKPAPAENTRCIYCQELLDISGSFSGHMRGIVGVILTVILLAAILSWLF